MLMTLQWVDTVHLSMATGERELAPILVLLLHFYQDCISDPWAKLTEPVQYEVRSNPTIMEETLPLPWCAILWGLWTKVQVRDREETKWPSEHLQSPSKWIKYPAYFQLVLSGLSDDTLCVLSFLGRVSTSKEGWAMGSMQVIEEVFLGKQLL